MKLANSQSIEEQAEQPSPFLNLPDPPFSFLSARSPQEAMGTLNQLGFLLTGLGPGTSRASKHP